MARKYIFYLSTFFFLQLLFLNNIFSQNFDPLYIEGYVKLGTEYRDTGELEKAEKVFYKALLQCPDDVNDEIKLKIIFELAKIYSKREKYQYAEDSFILANKLTKSNDQKSLILFELAKIYLNTEQFEKAIQHFDKAIELNPDNISVYKPYIYKTDSLIQLYAMYKKGVEFLEQSNNSMAISTFSRIIEVDPNYKDAAKKLSQAKIESDHQKDLLQQKAILSTYEKKVQIADKGTKIVQQKPKKKITNKKTKVKIDTPINEIDNTHSDKNQNDFKTQLNKIEELYNQGLIALQNKDWRTAKEHFSKVKEINPNYQEVSYRLMEANIGLESREELEKVIIFYNHGIQKFNKGEWLQALIDFEKVKMLYPGYKDVDVKINQSIKHLGNYESENFGEIKQATSNKEKTNWSLAGVIISAIIIPTTLVILLSPSLKARYYLLQGKHDLARKTYERMLAKNPHNDRTYISLANIYLIEGRKDDIALKIYNIALKSEIDLDLKQKIISTIGSEYLKKHIIKHNSIKVLTQAMSDDIKKIG